MRCTHCGSQEFERYEFHDVCLECDTAYGIEPQEVPFEDEIHWSEEKSHFA